LPSIDTLISRLLAWIDRMTHGRRAFAGASPQAATTQAMSALPPHVQAVIASLSTGAPLAGAHPLLPVAKKAAELLENGGTSVPGLQWSDVADILRAALFGLVVSYLSTRGRPERLPEQRIFEVGVVGVLIAVGTIDNNCIDNGFHTIDRFDLRDFLLQASPDWSKNDIQAFLSETALLRALYDYAFAYRAGDRTTPRFSACSAVQSLLRLGVTYKGAFFYKATAGFGDTIFTPIYQLLKSRGVKFCFFHKVTDLMPSPDGTSIETIKIDRQAALNPGVMEYQPLTPVEGIDCWPASPLWGQIVNGEKLEADGVNFEEYYSPQPPPVPPQICLQRVQDFDQVILGIPVGALGAICKALVDQKPSWADMVSNLATVRTEAVQLWVDRAVQDLGGPFVAPPTPPQTLGPIATGYVPPLDTYSDMSQLLPAEDWPSPGPLSVAYFCGVMSDDAAPNDTKLATEKVRQDALVWTTSQLQALWTNAGKGAGFEWDLLHSEVAATGQARFDQQFWRANISPSERYVLSLPNTLQYRLEPGKSGYANLFLAGDWTKTPEVNAGAVEVAAMSGLAAASALSGVEIPIVYANTLYGPFAAAEHRPTPSLAPGSKETVMSETYLNYSGWITLPRPPFNAKGADFYSFVFPADLEACQSYVDKTYNAIAGRQKFSVLLDVVFLACVKNTAIVATTPPFSNQGGTPEIDIGFWLLVGSYDKGATLPARIAWVPAYLFVDSGLAVSVGREIMGYPKYFANITVPATSPSAGPFTASAMLIRKFSPDAIASQQQFLSLHGTDFSAAPAENISASPNFRAEVFARLSAGASPALLKPIASGQYGSQFLFGLNIPVPVWYLKQFRSAYGSDSAIYQTLLEGPLTLTTLRQAQLLLGKWTLELGAFNSLPFVRELGLGTPKNGTVTLTTNIGFWASCDYTSGTAVPIV